MLTPAEALEETSLYLGICFAGVPFITAYNVISSIFRGAGDSKRPMYFVGVACVVNIALDFVLIGGLSMGAAGAALGTVLGQAVSVAFAFVMLKQRDLGFQVTGRDIRADRETISQILRVGAPIACQDGLIQVAFIVITVIANSRGLVVSAAVGIVEKLIGFLFLVPSAFLSAISAITAQNMGADKPERARASLGYGLLITMTWGALCALYSQFLPQTLVGLFTRDAAVLAAGCAYLRAYAFDTFLRRFISASAGISAETRRRGFPSYIILRRFFSSVSRGLIWRVCTSRTVCILWGWAAPLGSLLSALICVGFYLYFRNAKSTSKDVLP